MSEGSYIAQRALTEKFLTKLNNFLDSHANRLSKSILSEDTAKVEVEDGPIKCSWDPLESYRSIEDYEKVLEDRSDSKKVLLILFYISKSLNDLMKRVGYFVDNLILYGEGISNGMNDETGEAYAYLAEFITIVWELKDFIEEYNELCVQWMSQVCALFKDSEPYVVNVNTIEINTAIGIFADSLGNIVMLEQVIKSHCILQDHWHRYKQMINSMKADNELFETKSEDILELEESIRLLSASVVNGELFRNTLDNLSAAVGKEVQRRTLLLDHFLQYIKLNSLNLEQDVSRGNMNVKIIGIAALFILTASMFQKKAYDKRKFFKIIWENFKKVPMVPIAGSFFWFPDTFINSFNILDQKFLDQKAIQYCKSFRHSYLAELNENVLYTLQFQVISWQSKMQEIFYKTNNFLNDPPYNISVSILDGLALCRKIRQKYDMLMLHQIVRGSPPPKVVYSYAYQYLELLKSIQSTYSAFLSNICVARMNAFLSFKSYMISCVKKNTTYLTNCDRKSDVNKKDCILNFKAIEQMLSSSIDESTFIFCQIALDWISSLCRSWKLPESISTMRETIETTRILVCFEQLTNDAFDCSVLYFHRDILPFTFKKFYEREMEMIKMPLLFSILNDCLYLLKRSPHGSAPADSFIKEVEKDLKSCFVENVCRDVETELRLQTHSHLQAKSAEYSSPFRDGLKDLGYYVELPVQKLGAFKFDLKREIENHLSRTFYNLATIALHDGQSYSRMRLLAKDNWDLMVIDDHLPPHSLNQGKDILDIVKNIEQFVSEFTYNLNNQIFVQSHSLNKHLDTVNILHIANSMRTHGVGMANTAVNFIYKFLRKKMNDFFNFLFNESVKAKLSKEIKLLRAHQLNSAGGTHTLSSFRAKKLRNDLKEGKIHSDGRPSWNAFLNSITQVGNALGFVRLLKSGCHHFLGEYCRFLPDLENSEYWEDYVTNHLISDSPLDTGIDYAMDDLKSVVKSITTTFENRISYFELLINAFRSLQSDPKLSPLKNFFVCVPSLTWSFVERMLSSRENIDKKQKKVFTDDGFAVGIAFLLRIFGQEDQFDSLHWFERVLESIRKEINETAQPDHADRGLEQASKLTIKKLEDTYREFELLSFNYSSARIFFKSTSLEEQISSKSCQSSET